MDDLRVEESIARLTERVAGLAKLILELQREVHQGKTEVWGEVRAVQRAMHKAEGILAAEVLGRA